MRFSEFQQKLEALTALPAEKKEEILGMAKDLPEAALEGLLGRITVLHDDLESNEEEGLEILAEMRKLLSQSERDLSKITRLSAESQERAQNDSSAADIFNDA